MKKKRKESTRPETSNGLMSWYKKYDETKGRCKKCAQSAKKRQSTEESASTKKPKSVAATTDSVKEYRKSSERKTQKRENAMGNCPCKCEKCGNPNRPEHECHKCECPDCCCCDCEEHNE